MKDSAHSTAADPKVKTKQNISNMMGESKDEQLNARHDGSIDAVRAYTLGTLRVESIVVTNREGIYI